MKEKVKEYDETSIKILEGLEAVRKRPGMYIGSTDQRGLHHLVFEILDNAIDEALGGFCNEINVIVYPDNSVEVEDNGRGMPYKKHESGKNTTEVIFTVLHAGGKFSSESGYKTSGGLHGVGASVVNALSSYLEVTIYRDSKIFKQRFEDGGSKILPLNCIGDTKKTGTSIRFKPDPHIFTTTVFSADTLIERIREQAFLIKNLKINYTDKRTKEETSFYYENGIIEYVEYLTKNKDEKDLISDVVYINKTYQIPDKKSSIYAEIALRFTNTYSETIHSFVNNVITKDGGTHEYGFKTGLTKAVNDYARKYNLLKEKDVNLEGLDIREGIYVVLSVRVEENILEFEGQTKSKLGTPDARNAIDSITYENVFFYLEEHKSVATKIIGKAFDALRAREAARKARDEIRLVKKSSKTEMLLSGKLSPAFEKNKNVNELYLVEGDSAGGSAKSGRNRKFQAILPLRGKVLNVEEETLARVLANEELSTVIYTIGGDFGADFDIKKCNYNKVIIMTDADTDGAHIQVLLITFFLKYMRPLIEEKRLFIAQPPLYQIKYKKNKGEIVSYAWTDDELKEQLKNINNAEIQRYKGLGEMNASQLWDTTMNPETRTLICVNLDDAVSAEKQISILMSSDAKGRREWIENNVDFELADDFDIGSNL